MGIFAPARTKGPLNQRVISKETLGIPITNFLGVDDSANILNQPLGQLFVNKNMEYLFSGNNVFLRTKRGSTLTADITRKPYGSAIYQYNLATQYFVWIDGTNIKHSDIDGSNITTLTGGLTNNTQMYWVMYGQDTNAALYGVNGTDAQITKVSGSTPAKSTVTAPALDYLIYASALGRLIGLVGHFVYVSDQQTGTGVSSLETWPASGSPTAIVSPDEGQGFKAAVDMGVQGVFLFKDTGVWILPNGNESTLADWRFPRVEADTGTLSPKTVKRVNYGGKGGMIYLGSDKKLRYMSPNVGTYGSGEIPSVTNSAAKIISNNFQKLLDDIPDTYINICSAVYWDRKYFLSIPSSSGSSQLDLTIVVDCEKLRKAKGDAIPQPYWFKSVNMNINEYLIRPDNNHLYGMTEEGYIARFMVNDKYVEEIPTRVEVDESYSDSGNTRSVAIEYEAYLAWYDFSKKLARGSLLQLVQGYLHWETFGNYGITLTVNAFERGASIPTYNQGINTTLPTPNISGGFFDVSMFDVAVFASDDGNVSQATNSPNRGHYFLFGFSNTGRDEPASIYGLDPIFKQLTNNPIGKR